MNFQWILLALFAVALLWGIVRALMKPMLENILRAACIPVAFIITFIIQIIGVFPFLIRKGIELIGYLNIIESFKDTSEFLIASIVTMLSPGLLVTVFLLVLLVLNTVHVTLIMKFLNARAKRLAKKDFKVRVKMEKEDALKRAKASEERIAELREKGQLMDSGDYILPDEDELEDLAEERVEREKRSRSRLGFFRESAEQKAISIVAGAVSGFLIFAILMMPVFHGMSFLSSVTDGIKNTDTEESIVYQLVDVTDKHLVEPYQNSFVIQLYDSVALIDLMNYTVRAGGRVELQSGEVVYSDDIVKNLTKHSIGAAVEMTAPVPNTEKLAENLKVITSDPLLVSTLTDALMKLLKDFEVPEGGEEGDIMSDMLGDILSHYKNANREMIAGDLGAITDTVVVLTEKGVFATLVSGQEFDPSFLMESKEDLADVLGAMSGLSVFDPVIGGTLKLGVNMLGTMLGAPADNETAYDIYMQHLLEAVGSMDGTTLNVPAVEAFVEGCASSATNKVVDYAAEDPEGFEAFLAYMTQWSGVQKAFMSASEDKSLAYFTMNIDGSLYILDMGDISKVEDLADMKKATIMLVSDPAGEDYKNKISPVAELVHYLTVNSSVEVNGETLKALLGAYASSEADEVSREVAVRLLDRDTFVPAGVTVEKMAESLDFENWTDEEKKNDIGICVDIIFNLMDMMESLGAAAPAPAEEGSAPSMDGTEAMLDQFVMLGITMDLMTQTSCMKELPPLMMDALVKNEMFSKIMTPSIVNQINDKVQNDPDITYADYMESLVGVFKLALKALER